MTDPTGCSFLSYRRSRLEEAERLIAAQRDVGIPTWQDVNDLAHEPMADELERVLRDEETASCVLWLTPEVADSPMIRELEAAVAIERARRRDGFFIVPVVAGGLRIEDISKVLDVGFSLADLRSWNLLRVDADPIGDAEAAIVARAVLRRRLREIHQRLPPDTPLRLRLHTRTAPSRVPGYALTLDWTGRFEGRAAKPGAWEEHLLPALREVTDAIGREAPDRPVVASGFVAIAAATALGVSFLFPKNRAIAWEQVREDRGPELWSLNVPRESSGFSIETHQDQVGARDLAVLLSVADDVEPVFALTRSDLPPFRAILHVTKAGGIRHALEPGQAADLAFELREALRSARRRFRQIGCIHLFMAVPAGFALMLGQLLNTLGPVQTYEHVSDGGPKLYRPAALLHPSR